MDTQHNPVEHAVDEALHTLPQPSEASIDALSHADTPSADTDAFGTPFDPLLHQKGKTKSGAWKRKPQRRKAFDDAGSHLALPPEQAYSTEAYASAVTVTQSMFMCLQMLFGSDWAPVIDKKTGIDENHAITHATAVYFESKEIKDIPPGCMLAMVLSMYALPRLARPTTKQKLAGLVYWFKVKILRRKPANGSQFNIWPNGVREDDVSQTDGGEFSA